MAETIAKVEEGDALVGEEAGRFDAVREWIRGELAAQAMPSLAVAVAQGGRILWEEGFGWADRAARMPATEHTLYSLASISKPITTTAMMVLAEQGKIDLDRPLNEYLSPTAQINGRAFDAAGATVRRVANHTSGLPLHYQFFYTDEPEYAVPPPRDETIRRYASLMAPPGERYQYCNLGYGLLDHAIARLSGRTYADFLRESVFLPLGMTRSSVDIAPGLEPYTAQRYGTDGVAYPFYDFDHPGGSAVYCSAHDLVRFGLLHLKQCQPDQKTILSDAGIDAMQQDSVQLSGGPQYGFGWNINPDRGGHRTIGHGGGMGGVSTRLEMLPDEGISLVVLSNASNDLPGRAGDEILEVLLPGYKERFAEQRAKREKEKADAAPAAAEIAPDPTLLGEWRGDIHTYKGVVPLTLIFQPDGDIHAKVGDQLKTLVNDATFENDRLSGVLAGDIGTEDASRRMHRLHLDLKRRIDADGAPVLNGSTAAIFWLPFPPGGAPGRRVGNALSSWTELRRAAA